MVHKIIVAMVKARVSKVASITFVAKICMNTKLTTVILALLLTSSHSKMTLVWSKPLANTSVMAFRMGFLASMACCCAGACVHRCVCVFLLRLFLGCCNRAAIHLLLCTAMACALALEALPG